MPDPFEALREAVTPVEPDPTFATGLRALVRRALTAPEGVTVSTLTPDPVTPSATEAAGTETVREGDVAYASLWVRDVERAAAFYGAVLGWEYESGSAPQGRQIVGREPHHGMWEVDDLPTLYLAYSVDDVDAAVERVRAASGTAAAPTVEPYGRIAECVDTAGTRFSVHEITPGSPRGSLNGSRRGDLSYVTMEVVDSAATRAFYGTVLGWEFESGNVDDGWEPVDVHPMTGLHGGHDRVTVVPMYRVDDIAAAVERVRAGGGTAPDPERQPYGLSALCVDDQDTRFYLWEE